ncbi:MAG: aminoacyl-tRNA deacylase [Chloroflexi bacterium]|nr:aminoacyl-tRNA deacylase [Chloroflexota bacterium]
MPKAKKLNSMRLLEARSIPYETYHYEPQIRDAAQVAAAVGLPAEEVFKTLVVECPSRKKPILVLLPCERSLNLKRLAKALDEKKVALAPYARAEKLTGLQVGGISPLALMQKGWDVYLDKRGLAVAHIVVSAGQRGMQVRLESAALIDLLGCEIIDVADRKPA